MIGFVVQNFYTKSFLLKTQKYNTLVLAYNTQLIFLFIKRLTYNTYDPFYTSFISMKYKLLFRSLFVQPFWRFLRTIKTRYFGLVTINLTKSYYFETFRTLNTFLSPQLSTNVRQNAILVCNDTTYSKPVGALPFSFQKTTYNTFIFFLFFKLISIYSSPQNDFQLYYSYVLKPVNFQLYPFLNLFYFRLIHF
jgi:hypothetical protein